MKPFEITPKTFIRPALLNKISQLITKPGLIIVWGPSGTGKTTAVQLAAKMRNKRIVEVDEQVLRSSSAVRELLKEVRMKSLIPKVYVLDVVRPPSTWFLKQVAQATAYPFVVIQTEKPNLPDDIRYAEVYFPKLKRKEVIDYLVSVFGPGIDTTKVTSDLRQSLLAVMNSSTPSYTEDIFTKLDKIFSGVRVEEWDDSLWFWILEHIDDFFSGRNLLEAIKMFTNAQLFNAPKSVCFKPLNPKKPMYVRYRYPYYFMRKRGEKNE